MKAVQKNYPQEDRRIEIYEKYIGLQSGIDSRATSKEYVLAAMKEYTLDLTKELAKSDNENQQLKKILNLRNICYRCGAEQTLNKGLCYGCTMLKR